MEGYSMILVTGASGTLGKEISRQLAQRKSDFRCLVRKSSKVKELEEIGANLCYGDVTDRDSLNQAMQGVQQVISTHCLGMPKKGITCWDVDYQGNLDLIECLKENGGGKFIYISSLGAALDSRFPLNKVKHLVQDCLKISGLDYTIFRPSGFFSDFTTSANIAQKYHLFPAMGWGNHRIQGIRVSDLASCIIDSLHNTKASNQIISIGGPEVLTFKHVAAIYSNVLGHKVRIFPIPMGLVKIVGWIVDTFTSYRYNVQGLVDAFTRDSTCDNQPLLEIFDIKLGTFEEYLREYLAENLNK
jgi:uncharacterized protein YbjT (DUF2867 family)